MRGLLLAALMLWTSGAWASDAIPDDLLSVLFERSKTAECRAQCDVQTLDNEKMYLVPIKSADGRALYEATYFSGYCGSSGCYGAVLERKADKFIVLGEIQGITPKWIAQIIALKSPSTTSAATQSQRTMGAAKPTAAVPVVRSGGLASLKRGTYVDKDTPCETASNATIINF